MADTPYASLTDVENILPPDEEMPEANSREQNNLLTAILEATDLVIGYLEREYTGEVEGNDPVPDDVPGAVRRVVARVAMRSFTEEPFNPGAESEVNLMGPFSHTLNWSKEAQARSVWLSEGERTRLDRFKVGYSGKATHVPMYRCD
jgi:hypothetical protein